MKRIIQPIILTLIFITVSIGCNAQLLPISLAIKGGSTSSNLRNMHHAKNKNGFNAGLSIDINLPSNVRIYTGIEVLNKGAKNAGETADLYDKINALYIQIPAKLGYNIKVIPGLGFHFGVGPYFAHGMSGKIEKRGMKEKFETFSHSTLKRFDWGLGAEIGTMLLSIFDIRLGYDLGLANIAQKEWGSKVRNENFYASLGIRLF